MNKISDLSFFRLLSECSQRKVFGIRVYVWKLLRNWLFIWLISVSANRIIAFYYAIFHSDYIDLNRIMYGLSKKKMPYLYPIDEAIGLLNNEIRLVEWRIKYPEQFKSHFNKQPFSPLYLADKTNLIDIMEIISGLFLSKHIVYKNDKPTFLSDLSKVTGA